MPLRNFEADPDFQSFPDAVKDKIRADAAATQPARARSIFDTDPPPKAPKPQPTQGPRRPAAPPKLPAFVTSPAPTMLDGYPVSTTPPAPPAPPLKDQYLAGKARQIPANLQATPDLGSIAKEEFGEGFKQTLTGEIIDKAQQDVAAIGPAKPTLEQQFKRSQARQIPDTPKPDSTAHLGIRESAASVFGDIANGTLSGFGEGAVGAAANIAGQTADPAAMVSLAPVARAGRVAQALAGVELAGAQAAAMGDTSSLIANMAQNAALGALTGGRVHARTVPHEAPPAGHGITLHDPAAPPPLHEAELMPPEAPAPTPAGGSPLALPAGLEERIRQSIQAANDSARTLGREHPETQRLLQDAKALIAQRDAGNPAPDPTGRANTATPPAVITAPGAARPMAYTTDPAQLSAREWYHGTGTEGLTPELLDPNMTRIDGLFGHGIYLTDNPDIAGGYANARAKRTGTPTVYKAGVNVGKVIDLEAPLPPDVLPHFQDAADQFGPDVRAAVDEAAASPKATGETVYRAFSEAIGDGMHQGDFASGDAAEVLQYLSGNLKQAGYDAFTHVGGKRTGRDGHQVLIMLDPNDHMAGYMNAEGQWVGSGEGRDRQIHTFDPLDFNQPNTPPLPVPAGARRGSVGFGDEPARVIQNRIKNLQRARAEAERMGDTAKVQELDDAIQRLGDAGHMVHEEAPVNPTAAAGVNAARYYNPAKYAFSRPEVRQLFEANTQEVAARLQAQGIDPKTRVPLSEVIAEAQAMSPEAVDQLKFRRDAKSALNRTEYEAARATLQQLTEESYNLEQQLAHARATGQPPEVQQELVNQLHSLDKDIDGFTAAVTIARSEKGRELSYLRRITQQGFDVDYWLARASRLSGGQLTSPLNNELRGILVRGQTAQAAGDAAGMRAARIDLAKAMGRLDESGIAEVLSSFRKAGLLTGIKTIGRNMGSNALNAALEEVVRLPAPVIDAAMSMLTGQRTVVAPSLGKVARGLGDVATKGVREFGETMIHGIPLEQLAALEVPREVNSGIKPLDFYINTVFRFQSAQDRLFKAYGMRRSLDDQAQVIARNQLGAGNTPAHRAMVDQLRANPTDEMIREAIADAEFGTFQNDTAVSNAISRARAGLRQHGPVGSAIEFASHQILPFAKTPSAVATRVLDFTPVGVVGRAVVNQRNATALGHARRGNFGEAGAALAAQLSPAEQKAIALGLSRGMVGSALIYAGAKLYERGMLTGTYDRNTKENDEAAGRTPGSVKLGGEWRPLGAFSPVGNLLVLGATLARDGWSGPGVAAAGMRTVLDQPFTQGAKQLADLVNPDEEGLMRTANRFFGSMAGSWVPSIAAEVAQATDTGGAREQDPSSLGSAAATAVESRVPGLRGKLPAKVTSLGDSVEQPSGMQAFNPAAGRTAREDQDPVIREVLARDIKLPPAPKSVSLDGGHVKLTPEETRQLELERGNLARERVSAVLAAPDFATKSDQAQTEDIQDAIHDAHQDTITAFIDRKEKEEELAGRAQTADAEKSAKRERRRAVVSAPTGGESMDAQRQRLIDRTTEGL